MKIKTIKKNNNPINITTKYNKKSKKKTNKKGKSNILKKTKKINRKNKKLLIGGEYNDNFFSVELDDNFKKPIIEGSFSYEFMKKYIKNLNPKTDIPAENVYKKYREYRNDYKTKDISNKKIQDLREIRLNYYLKSVMSIMENEIIPFQHSQITFENKPVNLYNEVNKIKDNYDKNLKSKLENKDNKNIYYINSHGSYFKENLALFTVPDNIIIHFLTPLNYLSYMNLDDGKYLLGIIRGISKNNDNTIKNIEKLLKIDCFQNMITFLPGQKIFDINLEFEPNDNLKNFNNNLGIYNINERLNIDNFKYTLSNFISQGPLNLTGMSDLPPDNKGIPNSTYRDMFLGMPDLPPDNRITNIYVNCCRSCNNYLDNLTIETMYIYENFIKQLNYLLLNIKEPIGILRQICKNSFTRKKTIKSHLTYSVKNENLTGKKQKTKSPLINEIISLYIKNLPLTSIKDEMNKGEFQQLEINGLVNYIISDINKLNIINLIYNNIDNPEKKKNFIIYLYLEFFNIEESYFDIDSILKYFFQKYINILINIKDKSNRTPLIIAVEKNFVDIIELLLEHENIDVNIKNNYNQTPLIIAVEKNFVDIVKLLLGHNNIDVNIQNNYNQTPLHIALYTNNDIVKLLLEYKDININLINKYGETPLHIAANKNNIDIVKLLLQRNDININIINKYDGTPLHIAANNNNIDIVKLLLQRNDININLINKYGETPLHIAANNNNIDIVKLLLLQRNDINVNLINEYGETPLHIAANNNNTDIVNLLLKNGNIKVNIKNKNDNTLLHIAANNNNIDIVELLLEREDIKVNIKNYYDETPLHIALKKKNTDIIKLLSEPVDNSNNVAIKYYEIYNRMTGKKGKSITRKKSKNKSKK